MAGGGAGDSDWLAGVEAAGRVHRGGLAELADRARLPRTSLAYSQV